MSKKILVRADDLGFSEGINYGIEKSVKEGIIRSVGIMVNMPATAHGWNLLKDTGACFGLHTNICAGKPLCDPKLVPSLCDDKGNLKASRVYRESFKNGIDLVDYDECVLEVEAQYKRFVELTGDKPHYFEGHAVMSNNFYKAMEFVANKYGCDFLPAVFDGPTPFRHSKLYNALDSMTPGYDPFESLKKRASVDYGDGILMFVCHPGYLDEYILTVSSLTRPRPAEVAMAISDETKQWLKDNEIEVITYDDLD